MQEQFTPAIYAHPLKREIIATMVTNSLINRAGATFANERIEDLGVSPRDIAVAYALVRDALNLREWWRDIEASNTSVATQMEMLVALNRLLARLVVWLLRNQPLPLDIPAIEKEYIAAFKTMRAGIAEMHSDITRKSANEVAQEWKAKQVPDALAEQMSSIELLSSSFDLVRLVRESGKPIAEVGKAYFALGARFSLGWLRVQTARISANTHWDLLAIQSIQHDLYEEQRRLTFAQLDENAVARYEHFLSDLRASGDVQDVSKLMVALRYVRSLG